MPVQLSPYGKVAVFIFLFFIFLYSSCRRISSINPPHLVRISIADSNLIRDSSSKLSDFINPIRFISLERNEVANIGNIDKLLVIHDSIYVLDKSSAKSVFAFAPNGKFLGTIGNRTEYINPNDISYNYSQNEIQILDGGDKKVLRYSPSGAYLGYISLDFLSANYETYNAYAAFIGGHDEEDLVLTDSAGRKIRSLFPFNKVNNVRLMDPFTKVNDSTVYFREYLTDTIYKLTGDNALPAYYVDFGLKKFLIIHIDTATKIAPKVVIPPANYMSQINFFLEGLKNIYFTFQYNGEPQFVIYNKASHSTICYPRYLKNDITFDDLLPFPIASSRDTFYAIIQPYSLLKSLETNKQNLRMMDFDTQKRYMAIQELSKGLTELSNPIIMAFTFKNKTR